VQQVLKTYGDKIKFVYRHYPLPNHPAARPAAEAAACAGEQGKFWPYHDLLFANPSKLSEADLKQHAVELSLNTVQFNSCVDTHKLQSTIDTDVREGEEAGVNGTPAFYINGRMLSGAQPFDAFKKIIDQELTKAQAKIASGTSKSRIYVEMTKENKKDAPAAKPEDEEDKEDTKTVFKVPVGSSPVLGSPTALVTIIEFSDFQCPFCSRVEPTLKGLRDKYGDKVRLVWKNEPLPFHPAAGPAAEAAMEVRAEKGDKGFWDVHDKFFGDQKDLVNGQAPNLDAIVKMAAETGASADKIKKAVSDQTHKKEIDADQDLSEDFQASGTPHFFVNGRRLVGAQPQEKFEKIVDEEITKAQGLVAAGTKPTEVYAALTKDGKGPPEPEKKDVPKSLPTNDPARGNLSAKVTIHEWSDFQCPFCGRVEPTISQVMKDYGDRIKFVWHDLPLPMHPDAPLASQAGREAYAQKGPSAFWSLHDKMFANQQKIKRDDLDGYAKDLNLNMDKWKSALDGSSHTSEIEADKKAGNDDGISGTPAFIIVPGNATSGYFVNGAQAYPKFRKLIERALSEAGK
jgi:protein-disulfide isomerase